MARLNAVQRASESRRALRERLRAIEKRVSLLENALESPKETEVEAIRKNRAKLN